MYLCAANASQCARLTIIIESSLNTSLHQPHSTPSWEQGMEGQMRTNKPRDRVTWGFCYLRNAINECKDEKSQKREGLNLLSGVTLIWIHWWGRFVKTQMGR